VGLLLAVCHRPKLLVLDEPGGGLDPAVRRSFLEVVIRLLTDSGATVLLSSHIMSDLDRIADRIAILRHGQIILHTPLDELKENICRVEIGESVPVDAYNRLKSHPSCLKARMESGRLYATLRFSPEMAASFIEGLLATWPNVRLMTAAAMSLEDIFIELTEDRPW
jgi:ABC-2 type transport system ATP-binding protein